MKVIIKIETDGHISVIQKDKGVDLHLLDYNVNADEGQAPFAYTCDHADDGFKNIPQVEEAIEDIKKILYIGGRSA